jgi:hypothetical protein
MLEGAGENSDRLDLGVEKQLIEAREKDVGVELETFGVVCGQFRVRLDDPGQLNISSIAGVGDEAQSVVVGQAHDCDADRRLVRLRAGGGDCQTPKQGKKQQA